MILCLLRQLPNSKTKAVQQCDPEMLASAVETPVVEPLAKKAKTINEEPVLLVKKLSEKAKLPTRGSALAAGYDLCRYFFFVI